MKYLYKPIFGGWIKVDKKELEELLAVRKKGITTMSGEKLENYLKGLWKKV